MNRQSVLDEMHHISGVLGKIRSGSALTTSLKSHFCFLVY